MFPNLLKEGNFVGGRFLKFSFFSHNFFLNFDICYYLLANEMSSAGRQENESTTSKQMLMLKLDLMVFSPTVKFNNSQKLSFNYIQNIKRLFEGCTDERDTSVE